jgi:DNA-binding MarR family transcriptional regulator
VHDDPTPEQLELLRTLKRCEETGFNIAFDIALDMRCTPQQAAGRLRAAMRKGWVESYRQPAEYVDRDTYYSLTPVGREYVSADA